MTNAISKNDNRLTRFVAVSFGAFLVLRLVASFFPKYRLWGLDQAGFIGGLWFLYPVLLCLGLLLFIKRDKIDLFMTAGVPENIHQKVEIYFISAIMGILFYFLSATAHYLGDGYINLALMAEPHITLKLHNLGEILIRKILIGLWNIDSKEGVKAVYRLVSIASGIGFTYLIIYYASRLCESRTAYYFFILINLLSVTAIHFFGYVENYSVTIVLLYWCLLSGLSSLRQKEKSILPVMVYLVAVFMHAICLVYLPAVIFYTVIVFGRGAVGQKIRDKGKTVKAILFASLIAAYILIKYLGPPLLKLMVLSPFGDRFTTDSYYLFSPSHLLDYTNLLLFICPVTVLVFLAGPLLRRDGRGSGGRGDELFLGVAAITGLCAAFLIEPRLGMARDWDLMSVMLVGAALYGVYLWVKYTGRARYLAVLSILLVLMVGSVFIPWVVLHNSRGALYGYNMAVMELDPKHARAGFFTMKSFQNAAGNDSEVARLEDYTFLHFPELALEREGANLHKAGDYNRAVEYLRRAIAENPSWFGPYFDIAQSYMMLRDYDKALENLKWADGLNPRNSNVHLSLGQLYDKMGEAGKAVGHWEKSIRYDPDNIQPYLFLGDHYLLGRQPERAIYYFTRFPDSSMPVNVLHNRGMAYMKSGDTASALTDFRKYLEIGTDDRMKASIENIFKDLLLPVEEKAGFDRP